MKKFLSLILALTMALSMSATAFAEEITPGTSDNTTSVSTADRSNEIVSSAEYKLIPLDRETFYGESGTCTLDYLAGGYVTWSISLPGVRMISFNGDLHFNKLGSPFGTFNHSIYTTDWSGTEDVKDNLSKGDWKVDFTGIATSSDGKLYAVVDNASLKFYVNGRWK